MATRSSSTELMVVLESFTGGADGGEARFFRAGELIRASDPAVKKWPGYFGPTSSPHDEPAVEQATAAPGEKRG